MTNRIIIDQVSRRLRDVTKKTWQLDILLAALNSAFQSVVNVRPDSNTVHRNMTLVEGHEQRIDDDLYKLVHVLHNVDPATNQPRRAITKANMGTMDSIFPHWRQDKVRGYIEHYMLDELDDRVFYNWPPAAGPKTVIGEDGEDQLVSDELIRIVAAIVPVVTEADLDNPIPLNSTHHPAIMEWMLYYCYAVDDELTANSARPDVHFRNFFNLMNTKIQNTLRIQQIRENVDA